MSKIELTAVREALVAIDIDTELLDEKIVRGLELIVRELGSRVNGADVMCLSEEESKCVWAAYQWMQENYDEYWCLDAEYVVQNLTVDGKEIL